jgi:hypothetical protein
MTEETRWQKLYYRLCCFVIFFVVASISFNGFYQKWHFHEEDIPGDNTDASFDRMVDGMAHRPYVYRQLIPAIANEVDRVTPQTVKTWLFTQQGSGEDAYLYTITISQTADDEVYFFRYLVAYIATFLFALLALYAMYWLCKALGTPPPAALCASVLFMLLFPYVMSVGGFFYDFSELALFALAALMALRLNWWWLIPVAAIGELNKESFVLMVVTLYPLMRQRSSRRGALLGAGVLCAVCLAVYYPVRLHFAHNAGGIVEVQWREQLSYFMHPLATALSTDETYGMRAPRIFTLVPMGLLVWTAVRGWKQLPTAIKQHGKIAAAINVPLFLLFCSPGEMRDLSMLDLVFLLVLAGNLNRWIKGAGRTEGLPVV